MTLFLFAGCYTHRSTVGVHTYLAGAGDGKLVEVNRFEGIEHPSFLAAHPGGRMLYAVSETSRFDGAPGGGLVALAIDPADGSLHEIDRATSHGDGPCHVSVEPDGRRLHVANYGSGTVATYTLDEHGRFGAAASVRQHTGTGPTGRQVGPHAHCVVPGPDRRSVYAVDLGADRVVQTIDGEVVDEFVLPAGSGPRHLAFHPTESVAYIVGELDSTVIAARVDVATGRLSDPVACSSLPAGFDGSSAGAEVGVHPNGRFLYVSNRGHDSIAVFTLARPDTPELAAHVPSGGRQPRHFAIHPEGQVLVVANQDSDTIVPFRLDPASGELAPLGVGYAASQPVCLIYVEVAT